MRVAQAEPVIRQSAIEILDALAPRRHEEIGCQHVSTPLPIRAIGDVLGVPCEDQHPRVK